MADRPIRAAYLPLPITVEAGKTYWWCACGRSRRQPFCDGSHKGTGIEPVAYEAVETRMVYFCGCKATGNAPLCDGSHLR